MLGATSSPSRELKIERRIELLFSKFGAFYGHIWKKPLEDLGYFHFVKKQWQERLKEFSDEVIRLAIEECSKFYELPPTLPQMWNCCRTIRQRIVVEEKENFVPGNREVALAHIKQCLAMLKK